MTDAIDPRRIAMIGLGEAGTIFARGFVATGRFDVTAYDLLMDDPQASEAMFARARDAGVVPCRSAAEAAARAALVVSAVTASSAQAVAAEAARHLQPGQIFLDINSVSPEAKRGNAALVERSGAAYVEAAVMAPVPPSGMNVPILLGGARAAAVMAMLEPAAMNLTLAALEIGKASAIKMCRSIMIKGMEALTVECLLTARQYGVEDAIIASLDKSHPGMRWPDQAGYLIGRVVEHGRRRAAEMREVAETVAETGLAPLMAAATAERQDWVADRVVAQPSLKQAADAEWRTTLDALAATGGLRRLRKD